MDREEIYQEVHDRASINVTAAIPIRSLGLGTRADFKERAASAQT